MYSCNRALNTKEIGMYIGKRNTTYVGMYSCKRTLNSKKLVYMAAIGLKKDNGIVSAIEYTASYKVRIC
jgi:hypothetical protein